MSWNVRRPQRSPSELLGHIRGCSGDVVKCSVSNLSRTGAALRTDVFLPSEFELEIPAINKTFRAALRWKSQTRAGVLFVPMSDPAG